MRSCCVVLGDQDGWAQIGCQRPSRFWGLGCPKIYHEAEDTLAYFPSGARHAGKTVRPRGYWGLPASASLSMAGSV
ncbi:hypothetical protein [Thiolapillus sp.]|uniref:hypothetical protein n=1 Tax=Thiolapillus sp. TaxID=2017437 RepID=UPI0025E7DCF6|nr:hypothetical protein [Thiolapillus sp.]